VRAAKPPAHLPISLIFDMRQNTRYNIGMDMPDLIDHIVDRLSEAANPEDIILDICDKTDLSWPEAEALVKQVQAEHEQEVIKRQSPLLTLVALSIFVGGVGLLAYSIYILFLTTSAYASMALNPWDLPDILNFVFNYAAFTLSLILLAIGMILGSLLGMRQVWMDILNAH